MILDWVVASLGFLPISVYLVSIVVERLLNQREKITRVRKLFMIIGAFFGQVGTCLLAVLARLDSTSPRVQQLINTNKDFQINFVQVKKALTNYEPSWKISRSDLVQLKDMLTERKAVLLRLLENPILLEHEYFADLLWAVFHLYQELESRSDLNRISLPDLDHLTNDIKRAYLYLVSEWLMYMDHLQEEYPYLFSLALRTNPFDRNALPEIGPDVRASAE